MSDIDSNAVLEELVKTQDRSGKKWAEALHMKLWELFGVKADEDYLISFMCNAMMAMHDSIHNNELQSIKDQLEDAEKDFWRMKELFNDQVIQKLKVEKENIFLKQDLEKAEKVIKSIENGPLRYYDSVYKDTEWDTCCSGRDCGCLGMPIDPEYFIYQELTRAGSYFQEKNKEIESE